MNDRIIGLERDVIDKMKKWHGLQERKYTKEPYWTHPLSVANKLRRYNDNAKDCLYEICLLHDILEDTEIGEVELELNLLDIGYKTEEVMYIVKGVVSLTDVFTKDRYEKLNRSERKELEINRLESISPEFKTIKCIDITDNIDSIMRFDKNFCKVFIKEIERCAFALRGAHIKKVFEDMMYVTSQANYYM